MSEESKREAFVYMVACADGTLYTGWTYNPQVRLTQHNTGKGAKYTRSRRPVTLVYTEKLPDQQAARRREYFLKQLSRSAKMQLIEELESDPHHSLQIN